MSAIKEFIKHKDDSTQCGNYSIDLPNLAEGEQYRFHFNMTKCIACHCCEVACNEQNNNPADIKWRRVGELEGGSFPDTLELFNSMSCNHCIDPACLKGCPTESYIKFDNGIVFHDDDKCIGCQYCTWNCPYQVPIFHPERKIVTKCHMCYSRIENRETPACVQACPAGAIEIEVVNKEEWVKNSIDTEGNAPHLVDAKVTNSTTRYTLPKNLPNNLKSADEHILKPAHPELPLVFMTVLTQISLGGFLALFLGEILSLFGFNLPTPSFFIALAVLLPSAIGLPLSGLHLGRPFKAGDAMKNIKNSWLSREALSLGVFTFGMSVVAGALYFEINQTLILFIELITLIIGIIGIYSQSMIYRIEARPSWNRKVTTYEFFGVGYIGFILVSLILLLSNNFDVSAILILTLTLGLVQSYFLFENINFLKNLKDTDKNFYQLNRTKELMLNRFKRLLRLRTILLVSSATILPLLSIILILTQAFTFAIVLLSLALVGGIISELIGRYLFYVTVVPLGLAGNFFAGNQRD